MPSGTNETRVQRTVTVLHSAVIKMFAAANVAELFDQDQSFPAVKKALLTSIC